MLDPDELYEVVADDAGGSGDDTSPLVLVHALSGFVDAGSAAALAVNHLLAELGGRPVARFDLDQLYDYRARRPRMVFEGDRYTSVETPELVLHEVRDTTGRRFLLLTGPEPDVQWQRFSLAVEHLVERFGVGLAVGLQGVPWAAPHTRPTGLTAHASDRALISGRPRWFGQVEVPGHAGSYLELHLDRAGTSSMGFSVHVPHYLAQSEFPSAAVTLLTALAESTALALPVGGLVEAAQAVLADVDEQVAASEETRTAVAALERQYDAVTAERGRGEGVHEGVMPLLPEDEMADGDELAAELERYLRAEEG